MKISELTSPPKKPKKVNVANAAQLHDTLNPKIWDHGKMLPEVRKALLKIAEDFQVFLGITDLEVKDITISGSNAAYSYTEHSDLDLHLLVDIAKLDKDVIYRELFNSKKYQYNDLHNIKIRGINVELYVQDTGVPIVSLGQFSILNNKWIQVPSKEAFEYDDEEVQIKYKGLKTRSLRALRINSDIRITAILNDINRARKSGLESKGEFSAENLVYKLLRNEGIVDRLWDAKNAIDDKKLSLEGINADIQVVEGWKDWVAGAAMGAAALAGTGDAMAKQMPQKTQISAPVRTAATPAPATTTDKSVNDIVQTVLKPEAKALINAGRAAGMRGAELAQFVAQCAHETANFSSLKEFGGKLDFKKYDPKHNPRKAKILGNKYAGDGQKYHGRGFIQITGRDNYKRAGEALGIPLEQHPELAEKPEIAAKIAVWFWQNHVQPKVNNFNDTAAVTKPINSGLKGLEDRHGKFAALMQLMRKT